MSSIHNPKSFTTEMKSADPNMLNRSMGVWNSFTLGFAVVSPVVGLYAIVGVQTNVTGGGWFAALVICLIMQLLVATVYAELSSQFPIAGGAYKWARQLGGTIRCTVPSEGLPCRATAAVFEGCPCKRT